MKLRASKPMLSRVRQRGEIPACSAWHTSRSGGGWPCSQNGLVNEASLLGIRENYIL